MLGGQNGIPLVVICQLASNITFCVPFQATSAMQDKSRLESDLHRTQDELGNLRTTQSPDNSAGVQELEGQMAEVKKQMEKVGVALR